MTVTREHIYRDRTFTLTMESAPWKLEDSKQWQDQTVASSAVSIVTHTLPSIYILYTLAFASNTYIVQRTLDTSQLGADGRLKIQFQDNIWIVQVVSTDQKDAIKCL